MLKLISELFGLLTNEQRRRFWILQLLVILMAIFELIGVASIFPFIAIVSDSSVIESNNLINFAYVWSNSQSHSEFLLLVGVSVLIILAISSVVSIFTSWRLAMFAAQIGTEIADRLFSYYLSQSWLFHASTSSSKLTKNISTEALRLSDFVIQPLMQMNAKVVLVVLLSTSIVIFDPKVALFSIAIFIVVYIVLYLVVRKKLQENGDRLTEYMSCRFHLMSEGFGGVKDVILLGKKGFFIERFDNAGRLFSRARGVNAGISQIPRYLIEFVAFGSVISLILYLLRDGGSVNTLLPILTVYAFAGLKLLPAIQHAYVNLSQVKGNISAFEALKGDLDKAKDQKHIISGANSGARDITKIKLSKKMELKNICFSYSEDRPVLNNVSLEISANQVIGIVGNSGSGKSTLIDVMLRLIDPQSGSMYIDGDIIDKSNTRHWQNSIGFVPQSIFLTEGSVAENIAFGIPENEINYQQVQNVVKLAHLEEMIKQLPSGLDTKVGERGVQLSGGQRQRIAIARALYLGGDILIFDEATSALDGITEKMIMDAVHDFQGSKTIIMVAHRLKTVQKCDKIFFLENGRITDQGTYQELLERNEKFSRMAKHA